jgi:hypothetical protein
LSPVTTTAERCGSNAAKTQTWLAGLPKELPEDFALQAPGIDWNWMKFWVVAEGSRATSFSREDSGFSTADFLSPGLLFAFYPP